MKTEKLLPLLREIDQKLDYIISMIREDDLKYPIHGHYLDNTISNPRNDR